MQLKHIELSELKVSKHNVRRHGHKDVDDLIASIRALGVLQPLLVKPNGKGYEIIAGQRRYLACKKLESDGVSDLIPCAVMEDGDDAVAIEASLAENAIRMPLDEMDQYEAFVTLQRKKMSVEDIASHFGVSDRLVEKRLAIGNLLPQLRNLYREDEIDAQTLRVLTLASKAKQKEWLALRDEHGPNVMPSWRLKDWLLGGAQISTDKAIFDRAEYPGEVIADLFDEVSYFADAELFWQKQNEAIAAERDKLVANGWSDVVVLDPNSHFASWQYQQRSKKNGGKVFIEARSDGSVTFHKGFISHQDAAKASRKDTSDHTDRPERPEISQPMLNYLLLHRHSAVRLKLADAHGIALRLAVAHIICGSPLWRVDPDYCRPHNQLIAESVSGSPTQEPFVTLRNEVCELLGLSDISNEISGSIEITCEIDELFARLLKLDDAAVLKILGYLMAETLAVTSPVVDALGSLLKVDLAETWQTDETFLSLLKDREAVDAILGELAGKRVLDGNLTATLKIKKGIIQDCLTGENGRKKVEKWIPKYLRFPMAFYTKRGPGTA